MRTRTTVVLATVTAAAAVVGLGASAASASHAEPDTVVVPAFYENIKPWDSITIPSLSCPGGSYLVNQDLSPGRLVPKGVEVQELRYGLAPAGAVGVTIRDRRAVKVEIRPGVYVLPLVGTRADNGFSTATNWDIAASHAIVVKLHCTTDLDKAARGLYEDL